MAPSIVLTAYNIDGTSVHTEVTESDYADWVTYVCDHIDEKCGFEVEVDSAPFGHAPGDDAFTGTDEQIEAMREAMRSIWDDYCARGY